MGEWVSVDGVATYAREPWEIDVTELELPAHIERRVRGVLDNYGVHESDAEEALGDMVQLIGPAITAAVLRKLIRLNGQLFMGISDPHQMLQKIIQNQDQQNGGE